MTGVDAGRFRGLVDVVRKMLERDFVSGEPDLASLDAPTWAATVVSHRARLGLSWAGGFVFSEFVLFRMTSWRGTGARRRLEPLTTLRCAPLGCLSALRALRDLHALPLPPRLRRALARSGEARSGVGAAGFEPTTSCSQSKRATNCATPRSPVTEWREGADISRSPRLCSACCHFLRPVSRSAWARARKAAARWERRFFVAKSISAMVSPRDGTRKSGS